MGFMETIERPWKHPIDYLALVLWVVLFLIMIAIMTDGLRALGDFIKDAANAVVD